MNSDRVEQIREQFRMERIDELKSKIFDKSYIIELIVKDMRKRVKFEDQELIDHALKELDSFTSTIADIDL